MRWLFLSALPTFGCIRAEDPHDTGDGDADVDSDADCPPSSCNGRVGNAIGDRFEGFSFTSCDGAATVTQDSIPECNALLFNISTGWCIPCQEETPRFQTFYEEHQNNLSVVQILYQDDASLPPGPTFCDEWSNDRFATPLTFTVLIDPAGTAASYFDNPSAQMPLNMVVDRNGCITGKWIGTPPEGEPEATLESLL